MKFSNHLLVNYSVKKEYVEDNIRRIENILEDLRNNPVGDVFYKVYQLGSSFFHIQCFPNDEITKELFQRPAFQHFFCKLESSIEQEPMANNIEKIGFYTSL